MNIRHYYFTAAGTRPNRAIEFAEDPEQDNEFSVRVYAIDRGEEILLRKIPRNEVEVEALSTQEKINLFKERQQGIKRDIPKNIKFFSLSKEDQIRLLRLLESGSCRISFLNDIGTSKRFEVVRHLVFYSGSTVALQEITKPWRSLVAGEKIRVRYFYSQGPRKSINRAIEFTEDPERDNEFSIKAYAIVKGEDKFLNTIQEEEIEIEPLSTSEKIKFLKERKKYSLETKKFPSLSKEEKTELLRKLEPDGAYRIEMTVNLYNPKGFEVVKRLRFFDIP